MKCEATASNRGAENKRHGHGRSICFSPFSPLLGRCGVRGRAVVLPPLLVWIHWDLLCTALRVPRVLPPGSTPVTGRGPGDAFHVVTLCWGSWLHPWSCVPGTVIGRGSGRGPCSNSLGPLDPPQDGGPWTHPKDGSPWVHPCHCQQLPRTPGSAPRWWPLDPPRDCDSNGDLCFSN